jgi:hypothetical protein
MIMLDLEPIKARFKVLTKGPWLIENGEWTICDVGDWGWVGSNELNDVDNIDDIVSFIAHAKEDIPALIAEVKRLREELQEAESQIPAFADRIHNAPPWRDHAPPTT